MSWSDNQEQNTQREYEGYTGSSHYYEQPHAQQQQRTYEQPHVQQQTYEQPHAQQQQMYEQPLQSSTAQEQPHATASLFSDERFAAILCYSCGWLTGLLFVLYARRKPFIRFHALQSLIFFGIVNLIDVGLLRFMAFDRYYIGRMWVWAFLFFLLLNFVAFVGWIVAMVQAGHGTYYKMPFVGSIIAKRINGKETPRW